MEIQKWEYKRLWISFEGKSMAESERAMAQLGNNGWELVAVRASSHNADGEIWYFKRPKR